MHKIGRWTRGLGLAAALALSAGTAGAQAWFASLSGPAESPPNSSVGTGFARFTLTGRILTITGSFANLSGNTTASHIHCCTATSGTGTAGVATTTPTFVGFPSGVTSGTFTIILDLDLASSYNAAFVTANGGTPTAASSVLLAGLNSGKSYLNIHTSAFPGGEIRGFIEVVPEPSTYVLMATGLLGMVVISRRRRSA